MEGFLSIIFNIDLIIFPQIKDYWKTIRRAEAPVFSHVMSLYRFELPFSVLHISYCEGNVVRRVHKVKLLLECVILMFQAHFYPGLELAIDEAMVGFRSRLGAK